MQNSIINESENYIKEGIYQKFIEKTLNDFKENNNITITCKLLHYSSESTLYYIVKVYKNTNINPFEQDILFSFEFINGETPYVSILTDFSEPTMNDNRNYYRCLTKEHNYIFYFDEYSALRKILKFMISGINNFLIFIKESIEVKYFIYFGEYEFKHVYQINDFLKNKNNFYRIIEINNNQEKELFIIFTKIYFMIFQPMESDKNLIKLIFLKELNEIDFIYDKNNDNNSLILNLSNTNYEQNLEFVLIDRKHILLPEQKNFEFEQEKNDREYDYSNLIKEWFTYQNNNITLFKNFKSIIKDYKMIFNEYRDHMNILELTTGKDLNFNECDKLIEFYERIIEYYESQKTSNNNINNKERESKLISNLIYLCSELINFNKTQSKKNNKYFLTMKKYVNSQK
jgi:hypothetical protein